VTSLIERDRARVLPASLTVAGGHAQPREIQLLGTSSTRTRSDARARPGVASGIGMRTCGTLTAQIVAQIQPE
jgi:hypothetical protein